MEPTSRAAPLARCEVHVRIIPYYRPRGTIKWWKRPRFSRRTYLSSLGRVTVKRSTRLVNAIEDRPLPPRAILCLEMLEHPISALSPLAPLVFRAQRRLSCPLSIYSSTSHLIPRSFVHLPVDLSARPYVRLYIRPVVRRIFSYIHSSQCALSYYFASIFFARVEFSQSFSSFSPFADARSDVRILTLMASSRTRHYDITFLRMNKF